MYLLLMDFFNAEIVLFQLEAYNPVSLFFLWKQETRTHWSTAFWLRVQLWFQMFMYKFHWQQDWLHLYMKWEFLKKIKNTKDSSYFNTLFTQKSHLHTWIKYIRIQRPTSQNLCHLDCYNIKMEISLLIKGTSCDTKRNSSSPFS